MAIEEHQPVDGEDAPGTARSSSKSVPVPPPVMMNIASAHLLEREAIARTRAGSDGIEIASTESPATSPSIGLALSGGGIRSATFSLGVLQAFARHDKLTSFDFLSTVSGGGYIGSWLSAWIYRKGLAQVQEKLALIGSKTPTSMGDPPTAAEPPEVAWLRKYSNYLAPRVGLTSVDSLTLLTTWLRNVSLNAIVIFGFLVTLLLLPFEVLKLLAWSEDIYIEAGFAAAICGVFFFAGVAYNLWHQSITNRRDRNWILSTAGVVATVIVPGYLACCAAAVWLFDKDPKGSDVIFFAAAYFAGLLLVTVLAAFVAQQYFKPKENRLSIASTVVMLIAGVVASLAAFGVLSLLHLTWLKNQASDFPHTELAMLIGPAALVFALAVGTTIFTGMVGRIYYERSREWWSRLNAWLLMLSVSWVIWVALAFYSLPLLIWVRGELGHWTALLGTGWIGSLLMATVFKKPEGGSKRLQGNVDLLLNVAASVFVAGLLIVVSALVCQSVLKLNDLPMPSAVSKDAKPVYQVREPNSKIAYTVEPADKDAPGFAEIMASQGALIEQLASPSSLAVVMSRAALKSPAAVAFGTAADSIAAKDKDKREGAVQVASSRLDVVDAMLICSSLLMLIFGWRVDINKFSLHNMYKNRLVRCYLGASNQASRNQQPFTGLDDADDLPLSFLDRGEDLDPRPPQRPIHILNTTLNITQGKNLAWQERKAASFVFTPVVCGYALERTQGDASSVDRDRRDMPGYSSTESYASNDREERGFTLGMALATSGAAVSPNMGSASARSRAFVLTLFNVRLGRWSPNPAKKAWRRPSPRFGLIPMLQELFGYSNESRDFLYLSDGGHFENLGLYELVRRRCKTIFVVDAGADVSRSLGDIGAAVEKCRVDLGVEIDLPEMSLLAGDADNRAEQGFMRGTIKYDLADDTENGTLIVMKPTLTRTRKEPADVLNYASLNPTFPQQTTADQFFDESQFESYRRLGSFIADSCLIEHAKHLTPYTGGLFKPPLYVPAIDPPARSSIWIGWLIGRKPPAREGCRVDMVFVMLPVVLLLLLARLLFDWYALHAKASVCFSTDDCHASLVKLLAADISYTPVLVSSLDCFFVALFTGVFAMASIIGFQANRAAMVNEVRTHFWNRILLSIAYLMFVFVGAEALLGLGEDFQILGGTQTDSGAELIGASRFAALRWWASSGCAVGFIALFTSIWSEFKSRWSIGPLRWMIQR